MLLVAVHRPVVQSAAPITLFQFRERFAYRSLRGDWMVPPLALDIDGTLTTPEHSIDPRVFSILPTWNAPVVLATGKALPYPVALCQFLGIPERVIAENGGVALAEDTLRYASDPEHVDAAVEAFRARGGDLGWGETDTVNRWRETEVATRRTADEALLREVAAEFDLTVVDTQYAYHLKRPGVTKGEALSHVADTLEYSTEAFVAIGDSQNDVSMFEAAGEAYTVGNAVDGAKRAADHILGDSYMDGTLSALREIRARDA
jgi:phosphoglycolate phosphatase (TIGR01487 family)